MVTRRLSHVSSLTVTYACHRLTWPGLHSTAAHAAGGLRPKPPPHAAGMHFLRLSNAIDACMPVLIASARSPLRAQALRRLDHRI